ncbi:hypothetical protein KBTX_02269 [wastewater metagenome]|uniref:Uncharacterized protein n=2 Tax=unclassified sequences TaxID=12908 RepID=A0A5B8RAY4_9ZZZZ|nr:hypothetical protein KBTEX_02269 [uncultured organism]
MFAEARRRQALGEAAQRLRADELRAHAGDPPAREVELLDVAVAHASGAEVIAERRREGDRAAVAADQPQPLDGAHREVAGAHVVHGALGGQRAEEQPDHAHVVVEGQPGGAAVACMDAEAVAHDAPEVAHHRLGTDDHAPRCLGAPGGELQVRDLLRARGLRCRLRRFEARQGFRGVQPHTRDPRGGLVEEGLERLGGQGDARPGLFQQPADLVHVGLPATQVQGHRQRDGHEPGILAGKEHLRERRGGLGDHRDALAALHPQPDQAPGGGQRAPAQLAVGHGLGESSAGVMEVQPGVSLRRVVQRLGERGKGPWIERYRVDGRRRGARAVRASSSRCVR